MSCGIFKGGLRLYWRQRRFMLKFRKSSTLRKEWRKKRNVFGELCHHRIWKRPNKRPPRSSPYPSSPITPSMQRLEQDVFFGGTITSMFLVGHTDGIPHGAGSGTTVHSTTCGLGWRFGVRCDYSSTISSLSSPSVEIYFDALLSDPTLRKLAYTVSVTAIEAASATSVNNPKNGPPAVSCIVGEEPANGPNTPIPPRPAAAPRALGGLKGKSLKTPLKGYSSMTSICKLSRRHLGLFHLTKGGLRRS